MGAAVGLMWLLLLRPRLNVYTCPRGCIAFLDQGFLGLCRFVEEHPEWRGW